MWHYIQDSYLMKCTTSILAYHEGRAYIVCGTICVRPARRGWKGCDHASGEQWGLEGRAGERRTGGLEGRKEGREGGGECRQSVRLVRDSQGKEGEAKEAREGDWGRRGNEVGRKAGREIREIGREGRNVRSTEWRWDGYKKRIQKNHCSATYL